MSAVFASFPGLSLDSNLSGASPVSFSLRSCLCPPSFFLFLVDSAPSYSFFPLSFTWFPFPLFRVLFYLSLLIYSRSLLSLPSFYGPSPPRLFSFSVPLFCPFSFSFVLFPFLFLPFVLRSLFHLSRPWLVHIISSVSFSSLLIFSAITSLFSAFFFPALSLSSSTFVLLLFGCSAFCFSVRLLRLSIS